MKSSSGFTYHKCGGMQIIQGRNAFLQAYSMGTFDTQFDDGKFNSSTWMHICLKILSFCYIG